MQIGAGLCTNNSKSKSNNLLWCFLFSLNCAVDKELTLWIILHCNSESVIFFNFFLWLGEASSVPPPAGQETTSAAGNILFAFPAALHLHWPSSFCQASLDHLPLLFLVYSASFGPHLQFSWILLYVLQQDGPTGSPRNMVSNSIPVFNRRQHNKARL